MGSGPSRRKAEVTGTVYSGSRQPSGAPAGRPLETQPVPPRRPEAGAAAAGRAAGGGVPPAVLAFHQRAIANASRLLLGRVPVYFCLLQLIAGSLRDFRYLDFGPADQEDSKTVPFKSNLGNVFFKNYAAICAKVFPEGGDLPIPPETDLSVREALKLPNRRRDLQGPPGVTLMTAKFQARFHPTLPDAVGPGPQGAMVVLLPERAWRDSAPSRAVAAVLPGGAEEAVGLQPGTTVADLTVAQRDAIVEKYGKFLILPDEAEYALAVVAAQVVKRHTVEYAKYAIGTLASLTLAMSLLSRKVASVRRAFSVAVLLPSWLVISTIRVAQFEQANDIAFGVLPPSAPETAERFYASLAAHYRRNRAELLRKTRWPQTMDDMVQLVSVASPFGPMAEHEPGFQSRRLLIEKWRKRQAREGEMGRF